MKTIYERIMQECPQNFVGNHESDLYIIKTPETERIINEQKANGEILSPTIFGKGNQKYYDIPFAYKPFWDKILAKK